LDDFERVRNEMTKITLPSSEQVDVAAAREAIADTLQYWLDDNKRGLEREGIDVVRQSYVIPPEWPSRGTLENWIAVLRA
jgi:hypothetical protein